MQRQKRLTLSLFVGAVVAVSATKVASQNSARELSVETLKIIDAKGQVKAFLTTDPRVNKTGATLAFLDDKGAIRSSLAVSDTASMISLGGGKNNKPMVALGCADDSGVLTLSSGASKTAATLAASKDLSGLSVSSPGGKESFVVEVDGTGSALRLYDTSGRLKKQLP